MDLPRRIDGETVALLRQPGGFEAVVSISEAASESQDFVVAEGDDGEQPHLGLHPTAAPCARDPLGGDDHVPPRRSTPRGSVIGTSDLSAACASAVARVRALVARARNGSELRYFLLALQLRTLVSQSCPDANCSEIRIVPVAGPLDGIVPLTDHDREPPSL